MTRLVALILSFFTLLIMSNRLPEKPEIHTANFHTKNSEYNAPIIEGISECRDCRIRTYSQGINPPRIDAMVLDDTEEVIARVI